MNEIIEVTLPDWLGEHGRSLTSIVLLSMNVMEQYSATIKKLEGTDKLRGAIDCAEVCVIRAQSLHLIDSEECVSLLHLLSLGDDFIVPIIEAAIEVSKHPLIVQVVEKVETTCCGKQKKAPPAPAKASAKKRARQHGATLPVG